MLSPGVPGTLGGQGGHMVRPLVPCVYFRGGAVYFKGSVAQKVVLLISILEHAASLFRVACACNSPGVRGWGCCPAPRAPVARFGVWRRPCAARLLTFFLQRKTTLLPLKYLPACAVFGFAGLRRPPCPPRCPAHAATQKKGGSLFKL